MRLRRVSYTPARIGALRFIAAAGCLLLALATGASQGLAARQPQPPVTTDEWPRLAHLWQVMLDHSSNIITNAGLCRELAKEVDIADTDLTTLVQRDELSKSIAEDLRKLIHMRYRYLTEYHYTKRSVFKVSEAEASVTAAQWVIEMQLSLLRRPPKTKADEELAAAAISNLTYQLTFLYHAFQFEEEADRRRLKLREKEKSGEKVDWDAFDVDYQKRRNSLVAAHRRHDLPRARAVEELIPYIVSLTRLESISQNAAGTINRSDS